MTDSDDIALPERLALQVAFLRRNPEVVCVGAAFELIDGEGRYPTLLRQPQTDEDIQRLNLVGHNSIHNPCVMIRREPLVRVGGLDPGFHPTADTRPGPDRNSRLKFMRARPFEPDGWRLFLCALLKPFALQR